MCCRKKWNSNIFLHRNLFQRKKAKKEPKGQTNFLRPTNLRSGQKRPKGQLKFFRPTNLKRGHIFEIRPKTGQSGNHDFNLFLLLMGGGCILSISRCFPLDRYSSSLQCNFCIPNRLGTVVLWLLSVMPLSSVFSQSKFSGLKSDFNRWN